MVRNGSTSKKLNALKKIFYVNQNCKHNFQIGDTFSDVTIQAGSLVISSHKYVLEHTFPYYKRMFNHPFKENNRNVVVHKGIDEETIRSLIDMAYSNQLVVNTSNVQDIAVAADYLLVDELKLFCEQFMIEQLDATNVFGFRHFGKLNSFKHLVFRANQYIASNFVESTSTKEFLSLDKDEFVILIARSDLKVKLEEEVFEACKRWVNENSKSRSPSMFEILQQIRLALIKPDYLDKVVAKFPPCKSSTDCQQLITNVATYLSNRASRISDNAVEIKPRGFRSGKVYTFGKDSFASFFKGKLKTVAKRTTREASSSTLAVLNDKIYVTGGFCLDYGDLDNSGAVNKVYAFSPKDETFTDLAPMNCNRVFHGCCSHNGALFVCGGKDYFASTCCEYFNIQDNKWKFIAEMSEKRMNFQIVSCGKFIWAVGGWNNKSKHLNATEYYDDVIDKWTSSTQMLEKREGHSAVAFRNHIYIIGGYNLDHKEGLRTAEVLDTKTTQFTALKPMTMLRYCFAAAISEHKLYCFGSQGPNEEWIMSMESFNLYSEEWENEEITHQLEEVSSAMTVYDY